VAVAILGSRCRMERILEQVGASSELLLVKFSNGLSDDTRRCEKLTLVGVDLRRALHLRYPLLLEKLHRGDRIQILLLDPDISGCTTSAMREYAPTTPDDLRAVIRTFIGVFEDLRRNGVGTLEMRVADFSLVFGAMVGDAETSRGFVYLWHYGFRTRAANTPKMVLRPAHGYWHEAFKHEVYAVWDEATPWLGQ
jgi:hypothetical protein